MLNIDDVACAWIFVTKFLINFLFCMWILNSNHVLVCQLVVFVAIGFRIIAHAIFNIKMKFSSNSSNNKYEKNK